MGDSLKKERLIDEVWKQHFQTCSGKFEFQTELKLQCPSNISHIRLWHNTLSNIIINQLRVWFKWLNNFNYHFLLKIDCNFVDEMSSRKNKNRNYSTNTRVVPLYLLKHSFNHRFLKNRRLPPKHSICLLLDGYVVKWEETCRNAPKFREWAKRPNACEKAWFRFVDKKSRVTSPSQVALVSGGTTSLIAFLLKPMGSFQEGGRSRGRNGEFEFFFFFWSWKNQLRGNFAIPDRLIYESDIEERLR